MARTNKNASASSTTPAANIDDIDALNMDDIDQLFLPESGGGEGDFFVGLEFDDIPLIEGTPSFEDLKEPSANGNDGNDIHPISYPKPSDKSSGNKKKQVEKRSPQKKNRNGASGKVKKPVKGRRLPTSQNRPTNGTTAQDTNMNPSFQNGQIQKPPPSKEQSKIPSRSNNTKKRQPRKKKPPAGFVNGDNNNEVEEPKINRKRTAKRKRNDTKQPSKDKSQPDRRNSQSSTAMLSDTSSLHQYSYLNHQHTNVSEQHLPMPPLFQPLGPPGTPKTTQGKYGASAISGTSIQQRQQQQHSSRNIPQAPSTHKPHPNLPDRRQRPRPAQHRSPEYADTTSLRFMDQQSTRGILTNELFFSMISAPNTTSTNSNCIELIPQISNIIKMICGQNIYANDILQPTEQKCHTLLKLLFEFVGVRGSSISSLVNTPVLKRAKKEVSCMKKEELISELKTLLQIIQDQSAFLTNNLRKMYGWCDHQFAGKTIQSQNPKTNKDISLKAFQQLLTRYSLEAGVSVDTMKQAFVPSKQYNPMPKVSSRSLTAVKVKIKLKKSDFRKELVALMPSSCSTNVPSQQFVNPRPNMDQKSQPKVPTQSITSISSKPTITPIPPNKIETIPSNKIQSNIVKQEEKELSRSQLIEKLNAMPIIEESTVIKSNDLWKYMNYSTYWADITEKDIVDDLQACEPDDSAGTISYWGETPSPSPLKRRRSFCGSSSRKRHSPHTMLDRLQSLLVEEDDSSVSSDKEDDNAEENMIISDADRTRVNDMLDISDLSLDQKIYLQLRSIHLLYKNDGFPLHSNGNCVDQSKSDTIHDGDDSNHHIETIDDDIDEAICGMKRELYDLQRKVNRTTMLLQSKARSYIKERNEAKGVIKDMKNAVASHERHVALRQKEKRERKARMKDEWIPW